MRQDSNADWQEFVKAIPWFTRSDSNAASVTPQPTRLLDKESAALFPALARLLREASISDVTVDGNSFELFAWTGTDGQRIGWLCMPPPTVPPAGVHKDHGMLLKSFGGIVERFNEPSDAWLLNLNDALTARIAIELNGESYSVLGKPAPIDVRAYYTIACEANGNVTLCHRTSGNVLMHAHDHAFNHVRVLEGCPEYTFYTIEGVNLLTEWVEAIARQWMRHVALAP